MIGAIVDGDVPVDQRRPWAAELLRVTAAMVDAALAYCADDTCEIDAQLVGRARLTDEAEASWRCQRALLET